MIPSVAGTNGQIQHTINQSNAKGSPFTAAFPDMSQDSLKAPVAQDTDCGLQASNAEFREQKAEESIEKTKEQRGWRKVIRNFTPS